MRRLVALALAAGVLSVGACRSEPKPAPRQGMNIVLIVVDTLRADRLGCYGYGRPTSPNLDALAARSTVFTRAYSHAPWTAPAIGSLLTSLEPKDHGISRWTQPLDAKLLTVAEHLKASGYRTSAVISHAILGPHYGFNQGFDRYDTSVTAGHLPRLSSTAPRVTDFGLAAATAGPEPFFLWLHYFDPHDVYLEHERYAFGSTNSDLYDGEIAYTDEHIGRFLDGLARAGLADRTIVAVTADHGEEFGEHGGYTHSKTLYDELLRVPLIVHMPGMPAGRVDKVVRGIDVAPTLLSLAGLTPPPSFAGQAVPWTDKGFQLAAHRVHVAETQRKADMRALLVWPLKLIEVRQENRVRLYDLEADPGEQDNLWKKRQALGLPLREHLAAHYRQRTVAKDAPVPPEVDEAIRSLGYAR